MLINILLNLSIIYSIFCLQFDYLVTRCMEKVYGEIFYTRLEGNLLVQQTHNINTILLPFIFLMVLYILYEIMFVKYKLLNLGTCIIVDLLFVAKFILIGSCHLMGGLSWFLNGWF